MPPTGDRPRPAAGGGSPRGYQGAPGLPGRLRMRRAGPWRDHNSDCNFAMVWPGAEPALLEMGGPPCICRDTARTYRGPRTLTFF